MAATTSAVEALDCPGFLWCHLVTSIGVGIVDLSYQVLPHSKVLRNNKEWEFDSPVCGHQIKTVCHLLMHDNMVYSKIERCFRKEVILCSILYRLTGVGVASEASSVGRQVNSAGSPSWS